MSKDDKQEITTPAETITLALDVGQAKQKPYQAKFTPKKRKAFLAAYAKTFNITYACQQAGVTRDSHYHNLQNDDKYRAAFQSVKDAYLDSIESTRITVALQPSRDGHQDAKMMLAAHRRETYGQKVDVNNKSTLDINVNIGMDELKEILQVNNLLKTKPTAEIPEFVLLPDDEIQAQGDSSEETEPK